MRYGKTIKDNSLFEAYRSCGKHAERQRFGVDIRSGLPRRATAMAAAVVISAALMCPNLTFAADWVNVDGTQYSDKTTGASGTGWMWDGQDDLNLNGYMGGPISAQGDLVVNLAGENSVTNNAAPENNAGALTVDQGNLTIQGEGTLNATADTDVIMATGDGEAGGDVTISGSKVNVNATGNVKSDGNELPSTIGISTYGGDVVIKDGADVTIQVNKAGNTRLGASGIETTNGVPDTTVEDGLCYTHGLDDIPNKGGNVTIDNSKLSITASDKATVNDGIYTRTKGAPTTVSIVNGSNVSINTELELGFATGIYAYTTDDQSHVIIKDSFVDVFSDSSTPYSVSYGISSLSGSEHAGGSILIDNSAVKATSKGAAVIAVNGVSSASPGSVPSSTITITGGSKILVSEGGVVRDFKLFDEWNHDGNSGSYCELGQVIGVAGTGAIDSWESDEIARTVVIEKGEPVTPAFDDEGSASESANAMLSDADKSAGSFGLVKTGDANGGLGIVAAIVAAFTAFTGLFASRKHKL